MKSRTVLANSMHRSTRSGMPMLLTTLAVAATFLTTQTLAQAPRMDSAETTTNTAAPANSPAVVPASVALPNAPSVPASASSSEEAQLVLPDASHFSLTPADTANAKLISTPEKPHKGLAKTGAIAGLAFVGFGAAAFAIAAGHCKSYASGPCSAFHTGGIISMAAGGAVSATGFYFWFHNPKPQQ